METIFDLPAHPLMVHFPVVAIPGLALLGLIMAVRPRFRMDYGLPVLVLGVVTVVSTFAAARSGEALVESSGVTDEFIDPHRDLGNMLRFFVLGLAASMAALIAVTKRSAATGRDLLSVTATIFVVVFSLLSLVWAVRTGHEGAKAVWGTAIVEDEATSAEEEEPTDLEAEAATTAPTTETPTTQPPTTATSTGGEAATVEPTEDTSLVVPIEGEEVYQANCARCHGAGGGGGRGPSLVGIETEIPDRSAASEQIVNGGNGMPAFGARLDPAEIDAVVDYIYATFVTSSSDG